MYFSNKIVISNCGVIPNIYAIGMYFTYFESPFYPLQITNLLCHDPMTIYYSKWRLKNTCRKLRFSLKIFRSQPILTEKMARSKRVNRCAYFSTVKMIHSFETMHIFCNYQNESQKHVSSLSSQVRSKSGSAYILD